MVGHERTPGHHGFELPFGYYLERDENLLVLRRSDGFFVAAFNVSGVSLSEVELAAWEAADWRSGHTPPDTIMLVLLPGVMGKLGKENAGHQKVPSCRKASRTLWLIKHPVPVLH